MRPLGEYLIDDGVLTEEQVERAVARQRELRERGEDGRFGEVLLGMSLVTEDQLQLALDRQQLERT